MQKSFDLGYYEAIIQIRPADKDVFGYAIHLIEKRKNVFISRIESEKFGHDIYVSDRKYAAARRIKSDIIDKITPMSLIA